MAQSRHSASLKLMGPDPRASTAYPPTSRQSLYTPLQSPLRGIQELGHPFTHHRLMPVNGRFPCYDLLWKLIGSRCDLLAVSR